MGSGYSVRMKLKPWVIFSGVAVVLCVAGLFLASAERPTVRSPEVRIYDVKTGAFIMTNRVEKTDAEWRAMLTDEQYRVTRKKGTERPFTGECLLIKDKGLYTCVCCGTPLFTSDTKFDSGTGWPSYGQPVSEENIRLIEDRSHFMVRTEVVCAVCDAHLGHVFPDGPPPTGLRYCINSVSIKFESKEP